MKLIVGLGNPGKIYAESRHNAGFQVLRALAKDCGADLKKDNAAFSLSGKCRIGASGVILALPLTFMNLSGLAVRALLKKHKIKLEDLLVVSDDLDLEFGRIKIRSGGGSAGHRGLKSVISSVKSRDFCRLRLGIGRPDEAEDAAEYVLSPFSAREKEGLTDMLQRAVDCCGSWVIRGKAETMNRFNSAKRSNDEKI